MGLFFKSKKLEQYLPIKDDIENYMTLKLNNLNEKLRKEYVSYHFRGSNVTNFASKHVSEADICIDLTGTFEDANWKKVAEFRGKAPAFYQLKMDCKVYGAYYHSSEIEKNKEYKENCQLMPLRLPDSAWIGYHAPEILKDVHNRLRQIATEVNEYIKTKYPDIKVYASAEYYSSYSKEEYKIAYYKDEKGNPEQYREFFMDTLFDDALEFINNGKTLGETRTIEDYFNFKQSLEKEYGKRFNYKNNPKMFGLDISFDADARIKHLQFKAEHGYYIPDDYYKLIPQSCVEEIKQTSNKKGVEKKENVIKIEQVKTENNKPSLKETKDIDLPKKIKEKEINENSWLNKVKEKKFKFHINPAIIHFLIPIVISILVFLGYECGLFKNSAISSIYNKVHFEGGYVRSVSNWLDGVDDWLLPAMEDVMTIEGLLAFVIYIPARVIAGIIGTIWWLISWVIIAVIKVILFLFSKIMFIIPFLLYGAGAVITFLIFDKEDEKDWQFIVSFLISSAFYILMGISIFKRFF